MARTLLTDSLWKRIDRMVKVDNKPGLSRLHRCSVVEREESSEPDVSAYRAVGDFDPWRFGRRVG
jgi:hypothetical protein